MSFAVGPRFSLSQPPRWVPLSLRVRLSFGGGLNQVGWLLLGIGSLLCCFIQIPKAAHQFVMFQGPITTTQAVVTSVEKANAKENEHEVFIYNFDAKVGNQTYSGFAYETGKSLNVGQPVAAEYPAGRPDLVRLKSKRSTLFGWPSYFLVIPPLIGGCMVLYGLRRGRRWSRLLANGIQTTGRLIKKEATNTRINEQRVYKLTFEFHTEMDQVGQAEVKTHETERLLDEAEETLFYLPVKPSVATLLDHLPGQPEIDEMGEFRVARPLKAWFNLLLPFLMIAGNTAFLYYRYTS